MKFSDNLIFFRKKEKMTQKDLANKLNVSRKTISGWENERTYPDISTLLIISDLFNISINDLFNEDLNLFDHYIESEDEKKKNISVNHISYYLNITSLIFVYLNLLNPFKINIPYISLILIFNFIIWSISFTKWQVLIKKAKKYFFYFIIIYIINLNIIISTNTKITNNLDKILNNMYVIDLIIGSLIGSFILSYSIFIIFFGKTKK